MSRDRRAERVFSADASASSDVWMLSAAAGRGAFADARLASMRARTTDSSATGREGDGLARGFAAPGTKSAKSRPRGPAPGLAATEEGEGSERGSRRPGVTGDAPRRMGNAHPNIVPYQDFPASDGHLIIACGNDSQFERLCTMLDLEPELLERHGSNAQRVANRDNLVSKIAEVTSRRTRKDLLAALEAAGIPAGPINTVAQALATEQAQARGLVNETGGVPGLRSPIRMERWDTGQTGRAPAKPE